MRVPAPAASTTAPSRASPTRRAPCAGLGDTAATQGDELGGDGDRDLLRRLGTEVEPDRGPQTIPPRQIEALGFQPLAEATDLAARSDHAEVSDVPADEIFKEP